MSRILQAWYARTGPERFETYTRWTLYLLIAVVPFLALGVVGTTRPESIMGVVAYPVAVVIQTAIALVVIRNGITAFRDTVPAGRRAVAALLISTVIAGIAAVAGLPPAEDIGWYGRGAGLFIVLILTVFALTPALGSSYVSALALGASLLGAVANRPAMTSATALSVGVLFAVVGVTIALSFRISIWMLGVVWEQERTRGLHARLAVAEERLRFSRDLHDVMGRALSAVALKSELAAELARRDQGEAAAAQMLEVRELANDSLREVRAVVAGYRQVDLPTELVGARSMLRSAGVRTRVIGEDTALPPRVQSALAWVVREGATNVVRHSDASACTIDLTVDDDGAPVARLTITNDGVTAPPSQGSGLIGLSERLAALGGTITTRAEHGSFVLTARVPCTPTDDDDGEPAPLPPGARPWATAPHAASTPHAASNPPATSRLQFGGDGTMDAS